MNEVVVVVPLLAGKVRKVCGKCAGKCAGNACHRCQAGNHTPTLRAARAKRTLRVAHLDATMELGNFCAADLDSTPNIVYVFAGARVKPDSSHTTEVDQRDDTF